MTDRRTIWRRVLIGWSLPLGAILAVLALPALLRARVPGPVWRSDGSRAASSWAVLQSLPVVWIAATMAVATAALLVGRSYGAPARAMVAMQWGLAVSFASTPLLVAARDAGRVAPLIPQEHWWGSGWAVTVAALAVAVLGYVAAGPDAPAPLATGRPGPDAPRIPLAEGERVLWSRSVVSRRGLLLAGFWLVLASPGVWGVSVEGMMLVVVAAVVGSQSWARVRVDGSGVHVTQPLLRGSLVGAGIDEIVQAGTAVLDPGEISWSAYGVVQRPDRTFYRAARSGEMLTLELTGDRSLGITVPDAATAAALLNSELDRRRAPAC